MEGRWDEPLRPTPLTFQSLALRAAGLAVLTMMCCRSRHVRSGLKTIRKTVTPVSSLLCLEAEILRVASRYYRNKQS